ncbi:MAG: VWA domain-containing protein [Bdellovibrionota bacterium]
MSAEFYYPERALAFFVILLLAFFVLRSHKLRKVFANGLKTSKSLDRSHSFHAPKNRLIKEGLFLIALIFIALALMRPRWGDKERRRKIQSVDLCIALDLSQSMLAEDMSPNRLKFAKREMTLLLEKLGAYRVSLVGFAGGAFIASPLTNDLDAIADLMSPLDTDFVSLPSTSFEGALITCAESLGYSNISQRSDDDDKESAGIILLVSDGDDSFELDSDVVKGLKRKKITVNSYLVGKETAMQMPLRDNQGNITGFVRDPSSGAVATTTLQSKKAIELSKETKGKVYIASQVADFSELFKDDIKKFESKARDEGVEIEKEEQFQIPLLIAILLLLLESFLTETGGIWPLFKKKYLNFIWLLFFLTPPAHSVGLVESLKNNFGVFLFENGKYASSIKWFQDNIESSPDSRFFLYNWSSAKLSKIEKDLIQLQAEGKLSPEAIASSPSALEAEEISHMIENVIKKEKDPFWKKKWNFQLGNAYELSGKNSPAVSSYYDALKAPASAELDTASKHNLARLLKNTKQGGGNGQGNSSGGGGKVKAGRSQRRTEQRTV